MDRKEMTRFWQRALLPDREMTPIEVEFVTASGHTQALLTLTPKQIRPVGPRDIPAVRQLSAA